MFLYHLAASLMPPTRFFALRRRMLQWAGASVGHNTRIASSARFLVGGALEIGDDSWIGHDVLLAGGNAPIRIGARCDLAPRVMLVTGTHIDGGEARAAGQGISHPISIGDGVWIGAGSTVLGGTVIGDGAIIAAGSVVNKDIPPRVIAGGVPCRVLRDRSL